MKPTMEILERIKKNSEENKDEVFTRIYRYLLRPDIYFVAYQNLYSNNGASTKGVDDDTADGFSEAKIERIIKCLEDESYQPKPFRRVYIKKPNGKMRPLGIPSFTDKLVQEAVRIILEAIYEPIFMDAMSVEEMQDYRDLVLENIEYDHLCREFSTYREDLDEIVELIVETVCARRKTTRIAGADFPHEVVRSRFLKLDSSHIEFVMECLHNNTTEIRNMKQYLLTVLFNAPTTMNNHYTAQVNHDMHAGGW